MGVNTQFRSPQFADAYTYANKINEALELDGLTTKYNNIALNAFKNNQYPYIYPNINWWDEIYSKTAFNHRFNMTFNGGNQRFRYYTVIDYMHDEGLIKNLSTDTRYNSKFTDMRLSLRGNIDAKISPTTNFKVGIVGKLLKITDLTIQKICTRHYTKLPLQLFLFDKKMVSMEVLPYMERTILMQW